MKDEMVECIWCKGTKKESDGTPCRLCKQTGQITKAEKESRESLDAWAKSGGGWD
jgi:DnaJ-class molecular chaperone